jgi:CubicO group peptidase (beta-lactamase class C family)
MRHIIRSIAFVLWLVPLGSALSQGAPTGLPRARPEDVGLSSDRLALVGPALRPYVDSGRVAGIAMAVARHGKLVHLETMGMMDAATGTPMRPDAVFRIYSMTKPVTSVAIMQLYERGALRLDDPVSKFIPAFANTKVYAGGPAASPTLRAPDRPITVADLLTHTSGLSYGAFGNSPVDSIYNRAAINSPANTIAFFADSIARLPLLYSPGTAWTYSLAIDVLGRVVEVASGKTFDRYLADEIFTPLGMVVTSFHATPAMEGKITTVYATSPAGLRAGATLLGAGYRPEGKAFMGGQGLLSTIPDYLRFAQMLLNGGELEGRRILKKETVGLMMQNHLPPALTPLRSQPGYGFGYGGAVRVSPSTATSPESIGTFRWAGLASTFFWIDPKTDMIAMVWTQVTPTLGALQTDFQRLVYAAVTQR